MLKKFRQRADLEVWFMYSRYLMEKGDLSKARQLMQRALQHAQNKKRQYFLYSQTPFQNSILF